MDAIQPSAALLERLRALADARAALEAVKVLKRAADEAFAEQHREVLQQVQSCTQLVEAEATAVRALALAAYHADPSNKTPAPGVAIRIRTGVDYDADAALLWAREHGIAVSYLLDTKAFAVIAPTLGAAARQRMQVKETATATVTIAVDLFAALSLVTTEVQ